MRVCVDGEVGGWVGGVSPTSTLVAAGHFAPEHQDKGHGVGEGHAVPNEEHAAAGLHGPVQHLTGSRPVPGLQHTQGVVGGEVPLVPRQVLRPPPLFLEGVLCPKGHLAAGKGVRPQVDVGVWPGGVGCVHPSAPVEPALLHAGRASGGRRATFLGRG